MVAAAVASPACYLVCMYPCGAAAAITHVGSSSVFTGCGSGHTETHHREWNQLRPAPVRHCVIDHCVVAYIFRPFMTPKYRPLLSRCSRLLAARACICALPLLYDFSAGHQGNGMPSCRRDEDGRHLRWRTMAAPNPEGDQPKKTWDIRDACPI